MKAHLKSRIVDMHREKDSVTLSLSFDGKIQSDDKLLNAKEVNMQASLILKPVIADKLKIGSIISIELTDEPEDGEQV